MSSILDLQLHPRLQKAIDQLGFTEATDVQSRTIPAAREGKDLMVSAKTGGGKTAAFLLPMLERFLAEDRPRSSTRGLILLPTRELALQTQQAFQDMATFTHLKCGLIIGGEAYKYQVANIRKNPEVLIATPGRLVEHIEKGNVDFNDLEVLVLDEADRMLDMGFAEDMHTIATRCAPDRQTLLFSATLKHVGINEVSKQLKDPIRFEIDSIANGHSNIVQERIFADDDKHKANIVEGLIKEDEPKRVIIFCKTREQTERLSHLLNYKKFKCGYIHGELSQSLRKQILNQFKDDKLQIIVATDVAARGLDIKNVDLVINYTVAHSGDDHVHRIGRTGRSDANGKAVTLINALDFNLMSSIERYLKIRLTTRKIKGLEGSYSGPKKVKASGKAASTKKRKPSGDKKTNAKKTATKKPKEAPSRRDAISTSGDGSAPLRRKK
ncbi:MAG TPA: DEAD/DEAH box helicase [Marinagarivorans sp.]